MYPNSAAIPTDSKGLMTEMEDAWGFTWSTRICYHPKDSKKIWSWETFAQNCTGKLQQTFVSVEKDFPDKQNNPSDSVHRKWIISCIWVLQSKLHVYDLWSVLRRMEQTTSIEVTMSKNDSAETSPLRTACSKETPSEPKSLLVSGSA